MNTRTSILFFIIPSLLIIFGCKKMATPTEESKALFGSWQYKSNSGGFSGAGENASFSSENWIEFTEKGVFRQYKGSKKESQKRFKIELKESIYDNDLRPAIVYRNKKYETFQIVEDTLYVSDEIYDGYTNRYVRK
jgi:hypothetical protein